MLTKLCKALSNSWLLPVQVEQCEMALLMCSPHCYCISGVICCPYSGSHMLVGHVLGLLQFLGREECHCYSSHVYNKSKC